MKKYSKPELEQIVVFTEDTMDAITPSGLGGNLDSGNHNLDGSELFPIK